MIAHHLPALQIAVPLIAAPLCLFIRHPLATRVFAVLVAWVCLAISTSLLFFQLPEAGGEIIYYMGGWRPPWGISLVVDTDNA